MKSDMGGAGAVLGALIVIALGLTAFAPAGCSLSVIGPVAGGISYACLSEPAAPIRELHTLSWLVVGLGALIGAALGAWLRWILGMAFNPKLPTLMGTLAANLVGGFLVGIAVAAFAERTELSPVWRLFIITGFLGGLTTFSTFSGETVTLFLRQQYGWTAAIVAAHLFGSLLLTLAGIGIALAMGLSSVLERALLAIIPLMLTMPTILMVFLAVMWFGFSEAGGLIAVMAVVTPYVAVNIFEGARAMDKSVIEMGVVFKARRWLLVRRVYLPQLMPYIFSAFRYAFGVTWKVVALAETFGLKYGIGYMFFFWFGQFDMTQVLAWIVMFVILMLILEHGVFARLEHHAFRWRACGRRCSQPAESGA